MASKSSKPSIRSLAENDAGSFDPEQRDRNVWQLKDPDSSPSMVLRALSCADLDFTATSRLQQLRVFQPYGDDTPPGGQDTGSFSRG